MKKFAAPGILNEKTSRQNLIGIARTMNCEREVLAILNKYDKAIDQCSTAEGKKHLGIVGMAELHTFLGFRGALVVNGQEIIPAKKGFEET